MTLKKGSFLVLLLVLLIGVCSPKPSGCPPPPKGFSETDLVGSWNALDVVKDSWIIIRADGRYKQTIQVPRTGFSYESDWKPWRLTYSEKGLPYLHLEGLALCAYWYDFDCSTNTGPRHGDPLFTVGGTRDLFADETFWYDFCQKDWVDTPGEGVFLVLGVPLPFSQPPRGISLVPFTKSDLPTGPSYELR